ncbi:hypothetical protein [Runella sp.]|uniref:hypothetical protein n=1 Tax=Runella sp. TaxID=1960881 RepID=UPI003D0B44F2
MSTIAKAKDFFNRKILRRDKDRWNHQYESGRWNGLGDISELVVSASLSVMLNTSNPTENPIDKTTITTARNTFHLFGQRRELIA